MQWTVDNAIESGGQSVAYVEIALSLQRAAGTAYMGVGLGTQMRGADVMLASIDANNVAHVLDCYCTGHSAPIADTNGGGLICVCVCVCPPLLLFVFS